MPPRKNLIRSSESLILTATAVTLLSVNHGPLLRRTLAGDVAIAPLPEAALASIDPESRLARGERLTVGSITRRTLELIPGLSQEAKRSLVEEGPLLAREPDDESFQRALQTLPGIGPTTARRLVQYLASDVVVTRLMGCPHGSPHSEKAVFCRPGDTDATASVPDRVP